MRDGVRCAALRAKVAPHRHGVNILIPQIQSTVTPSPRLIMANLSPVTAQLILSPLPSMTMALMRTESRMNYLAIWLPKVNLHLISGDSVRL